MAAFREHITVSGMLGLGYGLTAHIAYGFSPIESALAGFLTGFGGMLPDLDSQTSRPVRELFGLLGAVCPLLVLGEVLELLHMPPSKEAGALAFIGLYLLIRFGGSWLIGKVAVHRGMFHSLPAACIAGQVTFLAYSNSAVETKCMIAMGIALGFLSHLVLDEVYSVEWTGVRLKLKKSAGSAMKMVGKNQAANIVTYGLLLTLSYAMLMNVVTDAKQKEIVKKPTIQLEQTAEFPDDFSDTIIK